MCLHLYDKHLVFPVKKKKKSRNVCTFNSCAVILKMLHHANRVGDINSSVLIPRKDFYISYLMNWGGKLMLHS